MSTLDGRVALITGGASGLDAATARLLAERGAKVVLFDIDDAALQRMQDELASTSGDVAIVRGDVSDSASCDAAVAETQRRFGWVDILVNNAGFGKLVATEEYWRQSAGVNLDGYFFMARASIRAMLAQGSGVLINIASIYGVVGIGSSLPTLPRKAQS